MSICDPILPRSLAASPDAPAVGPDDTISDEDFPEMSQDAADLGWIACEQFDTQD